MRMLKKFFFTGGLMIKKVFFLTFLGCLLFSYSLSSEIIECENLSELSEFVTDDTLLLLEIDNVILKPKEEVAKTAFFDYLKQNALREGVDPDQIIDRLYPTWVKIQKKSQSLLADEHLSSYLEGFKERGAKVLALSHRGPQLSYRSLDVLHGMGIYFSTTEELQKNINLEPDLATFYEGMLFLHPICDKGEYLSKFLTQLSFSPKKIVCVDHKLVDLVRMGQVLDELGTPFLGVYYHPEDSDISDYTIDVGKVQLEFIDQILPNSVAKVLVE